jgi:CheY-like chemotaxis protein
MAYALVIDDNPEFADSFCKILSLFDIESEAVYGPWTAISKFAEKVPTMIFLDINMPGVDGFEVLAYLKREPGLSDAPVIIVSSDVQEETVHRALQSGAINFIPKPVDVGELESALKKAKLIS